MTILQFFISQETKVLTNVMTLQTVLLSSCFRTGLIITIPHSCLCCSFCCIGLLLWQVWSSSSWRLGGCRCGLCLLLLPGSTLLGWFGLWWRRGDDWLLWLWSGLLLSIRTFVGGHSLLLSHLRSSIGWRDWSLWLWSGVLLSIWTLVELPLLVIFFAIGSLFTVVSVFFFASLGVVFDEVIGSCDCDLAYCWAFWLLSLFTVVSSLLLWQRRKEARGSFLIGDNCGSSS